MPRSPPDRRESTRVCTNRIVILGNTNGRIRAENSDDQESPNQLVGDNGFGRKVSGHITVNRVRLTDIQKEKMKSLNAKKTTSVKKTTKKTMNALCE